MEMTNRAEGEQRRAAFGALARRHEADLLRASRRLCRGDLDRAADLVQEEGYTTRNRG